MKIRLIGLGKMGYNIALNMRDHGHDVIGFARSEETRNNIEKEGVKTVDKIQKLFVNREDKIIVWLLVPNETVDSVLEQILPFLKSGDIVVDGGNSNFNISMQRYAKLKQNGISFVDLGTSGGTSGARNGACLMFGGDKQAFEYLEEVLKNISVKDGYQYIGESGSGHFVKMVHNGIEYGMMQAIGEGFELLEKSKFDLNYQSIAKVWNNGSIIESSLIGNIESALSKDSHLENIEGKIDDSGEGMWMIQEALKHKVSMPIISGSLFARFKSKDETKFSEKVVSAMRNEFGGHATYKTKK